MQEFRIFFVKLPNGVLWMELVSEHVCDRVQVLNSCPILYWQLHGLGDNYNV